MRKTTYSTLSTDLFKEREVPDFIKNHKIFNNKMQIRKVFPSIGLANFKEPVKINKALEQIHAPGHFAHNLLVKISEFFGEAAQLLNYKRERIIYASDLSTLENLTDKIRLLSDLNNIANHISTLTNANYDRNCSRNCITLVDNRIKLVVPSVVKYPSNSKIFCKEGTSLLSIYNKFIEHEDLAEFKFSFPKLEQTEEFKIFSNENIPNKEYFAIFSSEGPEGAWDLLTMSMRGLRSCQRWDGEHPKCLIGSISSRYVGIIYLTSGVPFNKMGNKMLRRCIVKFVINSTTKKPALLLDRMYPEQDVDAIAIFTKLLQDKTGLPVYNFYNMTDVERSILYLPNEKVEQYLQLNEHSYKDTQLKDGMQFKSFYANNIKEKVTLYKNLLTEQLRYDINESISQIFLSPESEVINKYFSILKYRNSIHDLTLQASRYALGFTMPLVYDQSDYNQIIKDYLKDTIKILSRRKKQYISIDASILKTYLIKYHPGYDIDTIYQFILSIALKSLKNQFKQVVG